MRVLSALDALFIYLERDDCPMHIGGVYLIDAKDAGISFGYETFFTHIEKRLHRSPVFRQRLVEAPLGLSHPCWINDPDFSLKNHLPRLRLPLPGGKKELMQLAAQIFGRMLDRTRPLWEMSFVEGLDGIEGLAKNSIAIITKVHHAAVDGTSGVELMGTLMDSEPCPPELKAEDGWRPEKPPDTARMLTAAYARLGRKSVELRKLVGELSAGARRVYASNRAKKIDLPPLPLTAPPSILNGPVSSSRTYWGVDFDFSRIVRIRQLVGDCTINDVVLAVCAQALRTYLVEQGALPGKPLIAMAPVSVRGGDQKEEMGNQVSGMLLSLATDVSDPLQRLLQISRNTRASRIFADALPANKIAEFIPSETLAAAVRLYTRSRLGGRHRPFFNLIITNVPGPHTPVYFAGARVKRQFGMAPIMDGLGLIIVVLSYAGRISLGMTSCYGVVPNPGHLGVLLGHAIDALEARIREEGAEGLKQLAQQVAGNDREEPRSSRPLRHLQQAVLKLDRAIESLRKSTHA